jgi:hypothetical protein
VISLQAQIDPGAYFYLIESRKSFVCLLRANLARKSHQFFSSVIGLLRHIGPD